MNAHASVYWLGPRAVAQGSFVIEPLDADGYAANGNALTLDEALTYAKARGGEGRITRGGRVVGYWGGVPAEDAAGAG